jgi:hypothetical protein
MYIISKKQRIIAANMGLKIAPSKNPLKKLDVYKDGIKVASIGDIEYDDYHSYMKKEKRGLIGKGFANERRRLYKIRHAADRKVVGSAGWYADKLLW